MPRRDGVVFFRGTAMALFPLKYFARAGRRTMPVRFGSWAYKGSRRARLGGGPFRPHAGIDRGPGRHAALIDPGEAAQARLRRARVAPARARQRGGEQRSLVGVEVARRLVEVTPRRGRDAELAVRTPGDDVEVDLHQPPLPQHQVEPQSERE